MLNSESVSSKISYNSFKTSCCDHRNFDSVSQAFFLVVQRHACMYNFAPISLLSPCEKSEATKHFKIPRDNRAAEMDLERHLHWKVLSN